MKYLKYTKVRKKFKGVFKHIYFSKPTRGQAPDYMITPGAKLVTTSNNQYVNLGLNLFKGLNNELPRGRAPRYQKSVNCAS